jgi:SAM-dependent methyltransferase
MTTKTGKFIVPAYSLTAALYDLLVGRYLFEQWMENFERLENRYNLNISCCADVACGTGLASRYLEERGAEVYAIDHSREMLTSAAETVGVRVRLLRQDMRYLLVPRKVDLIICAADSLNHLLHEDDIRRTLNAFFSALRHDGYVLFDMNSAWQLREGRDTEPWDFELDELPIRWISEWDENNRMATLSFIFPSIVNNCGEMFTEIHKERAYPAEWVMGELYKAGFRQVDVLDAAGLGKIDSQTRRYQFVTKK